jgi:hypothetical protein
MNHLKFLGLILISLTLILSLFPVNAEDQIQEQAIEVTMPDGSKQIGFIQNGKFIRIDQVQQESVPPSSQQLNIPQAPPQQKHFNRIFIDDMGNSSEADRFRILLTRELTQKGIIVVSHPQQADGILSGTLTTSKRFIGTGSTSTSGFHSFQGRQRLMATATVVLYDKEGQILWSADVKPHWALFKKDSVKLRAEEVGEELFMAISRMNSQ